MVNGGDLFISVVAGLAAPLAMLDGYRAIAGSALQERFAGLAVRPRSFAWLLALFLGPGLFVERMLSAWRAEELSAADGVNALLIALGWAGLQGFVMLSAVKALLPI